MATLSRTSTDTEPRPDRKQAILLAAEKLFAQRGYHAVSIRQIADEAGVPLALVGYYFGPKHDLFHAIFAHWNDTIQARLTCKRKIDKNKRDAKGQGQGVVAWDVEVRNQRGEMVASYDILTLVAKKG